MIRKLQIFFGPSRFRVFVALLAITGLTSLALNALGEESEQVLVAQTLLFVAFVLGAAYLILGRLPLDERKRWLAIIAPSIIGIIVGSLVAPHLSGLILGAGIGWIVAGIFIFRDSGGPENYKKAVKAMRKSDYQTAIAAMTRQIKEQPKNAEHYRFRAELHRLSGDLEAALRDYERMAKIDADSAVAYNGLAEVGLQAGRYENALRAATKAHDLAPDEWVAAYNLGMIEDRMQRHETAIAHLNAALRMKIPDSRHRLLVQLYLWRAYQALGREASANDALLSLGKEQAGLEEWQVVMGADEAQALREVLSDDIELARRLIKGEQEVARG